MAAGESCCSVAVPSEWTYPDTHTCSSFSGVLHDCQCRRPWKGRQNWWYNVTCRRYVKASFLQVPGTRCRRSWIAELFPRGTWLFYSCDSWSAGTTWSLA